MKEPVAGSVSDAAGSMRERERGKKKRRRFSDTTFYDILLPLVH